MICIFGLRVISNFHLFLGLYFLEVGHVLKLSGPLESLKIIPSHFDHCNYLIFNLYPEKWVLFSLVLNFNFVDFSLRNCFNSSMA